MAEPEKAQQQPLGGAEGGGGSQGSQEQGGEGGEGATSKPISPQYITPEILSGVVERARRSDQESRKKEMESFGQSLEAKLSQKLEEALSRVTPPTKAEGTKGGPGDNAAAILALEKDLKEAKARIEAEAKARTDAEQSARDFKFQTKVEAALSRFKCTNTGVAFLAIKPYLTYDQEADKITAKVKDTQFNLGDVEVDLDTFIKNEFKENIIPELFLGKVRPGAPASGDSDGVPGARGTFKVSDIAKMSPDEYVRLRDKIDEAQRAGRVLLDA